MKLIFVCLFFAVAVYQVESGLVGDLIDAALKSELVRFVLNQGGNPNFLVLSNEENLKADVKFFYLSREHPNKLAFDNTTLSLIDAKLPVKFVIHGWMEDSTKAYMNDIPNSYLSIQDFNIIQVDWSNTARRQYVESAYLTKKVGDVIGDLIVQIHKNKSIPLNNFHVIGHSLGGQAAGMTGKRVQNLLNGLSIARISALDPAGPYFTNVSTAERIVATDADMVDITHTDGGYFGFADPCGTIDFYPNGGVPFQPGCSNTLNKTIPLLLLGNTADTFFCSHTRSYHYYNYSIRADNLLGTKCDSEDDFNNNKCANNIKVVYGDKTPSSANGIYYFNTNDAAPYKNV